MSTMVAEATEVKTDRFGNPIAEGLPYARGDLIRHTPDDLNKLKRAEMLARKRIEAGLPVYNFTGLERNITQLLDAEDIPNLDDCWAPAVNGPSIMELGHTRSLIGVHNYRYGVS